MVVILNKFDILTEKLIKAGKSHSLLRIPAFIAVMIVVLAEGIYEIGRKVSRFLFRRRFLSKALSLAVAWLMFAPFYQPAVIYAMEETSITEQTPEETTSEETTVSEETPSSSEETSSPESSDTSSTDETTVPVSDNTDSDETTIPEETTEETTEETDETSVTPSETEMPEETTTPPLMMMATEPVETIYIYDYSDLYNFLGNADNSDKNVELKADIDGEGGTLPVMASYSGTFDGNGHVIENVKFSGKKCYYSHTSPGARQYCGDGDGTFYGMFFTLNGTVCNVGFRNVIANSGATNNYSQAAVVAHTNMGSVNNCFIVGSTIKAAYIGYFILCKNGGSVSNSYIGLKGCTIAYGSKGFVSDGATTFADPSKCTDDAIANLNNSSQGMTWYKDTAPDYSNDGYPSMKETTPVEFYKTSSVKFSGDELSFGSGKANADTYAVIEGNVIYAPDINPDIPRKAFLGWSLDPDSETPMDLATYTVDKNDFEDGVLKLYAVWDFNPVYMITFVDKEGNDIDLDTNADDDVTKFVTDEINAASFYSGDVPEESEADTGYEFDGWYRTDTDEKWDFATSTVAKNEYSDDEVEKLIRLKEKFIPIKYTITLDADGGEVSADNPIVYTIEDSNITLPTPTRTGYIFTGWKVTESTAVEKIPIDDDIVALNPAVDQKLANITVTAQWEAITYTVEYDINADTYIADDNVDMTNSEFVYDTSSALAQNTLKRNYYAFKGWATTPDGNKVYNDKATVVNLTDTQGGTVTLYAVWEPIEYTIVYENSENNTHPKIDGEEMPYTRIVNGNRTTYTVEDRTIELASASCAGYTFDGWKYNGNAVESNTVALSDNPLPESITISGGWTPVPYTVNYDTNGGYWGGGFDLTDYTSFDITKTLVLPNEQNIYRNYYKFGGWLISGDCNKNGTTVTSLSAGTYGNATATAVWNPINYTLRTDLNGGTLPAGVNIPSAYNNTTVMTLPVPSKTGYTFDGWTAVADSGYADNGNFPTGYVTKIENNFGNATLTANFTINQYTISFETNGGTPEPESITDDYGQAVEAPENPTKEGHDFTGWFADEECTIPYSFTTIPAENITVYAGWEIQKFDVEFETNGGSAVDTQIVEYGSTAVRPQPNPTKASYENGEGQTMNYRFLGWFSDEECNEAFDFSAPIKEDTTIYAGWLEYEDIPVTYNVSYKSTEDSETSSIGDFVEGEQVVLPSLPDDEVNHKVFVGFVLEGDTSETPVVYEAGDVFTVGTEDVVFIVVWDAEKHTVTFDSDGGTEIAPLEVEYNKTVSEPSCEKRGFILKGWFAEDGTQFSFDTPITEDIVLKAKWEAIVIPETPVRPGSSGSSGVKYDKTIRITNIPDGITAPAELFKATADMDSFRTSVDVRITNASESAEDELLRLLRLHTDIPDEDIFIFDISLYERGTDRKVTLPENTMVSLSIPVCDKFTSDLEKVKVISVHEGKLVVYPEPYISSSGKHLIVNFSSDKFSTFAFVLDKDGEIADISAAAPSAIAAEMMLYAPPAIMPAISGVIVNGKTKLRISRKRKVYKVVNKFH